VATETPSGRQSVLPPSAWATHSAPAGAGYLPSPLPHDLLAGAYAAHRRLLALFAQVDDATVHRPSQLPGWTVGHVATHLARNADSHARVFEAAADGGEPAPQYPGGAAQRDAEIQAGATRPAAEIHLDLATAITRLERAWDATHVGVWRSGLGLRRDRPISLADLVFVRWRELEVHTIDLGLVDLGGPSWGDLPATYVDAEWAWTTARLADRVPAEVTVLLAPGDRPSRAFGAGHRRVVVRTATPETLRWLLGRLPTAAAPADWPQLTPWD
jgi:maleylpyruvate isomerase